jgi:inward rectifier potassium channel
MKRRKQLRIKQAVPTSSSKRIVERNGQVNIDRIGAPSGWSDVYHSLLTISWLQFLGLSTAVYLVINSVFALLYLLRPGAIAEAKPGSFADAFFFSVQTFGSIGYGVMHPQGFYANLIVTLESLTALLVIAISTGLMFARFARPTARVLFSDVIVVKPYNGETTLMFRMANQRRNQIIEAQVRASLLLDEISAEGQFMRRFYDLHLIRSSSQFFTLSWTAMHAITEASPLYGLTPEALEQANAVLLISLVGIDETFGQPVHARHAYTPDDIRLNMQFVDVFITAPDGQRYLDYTRFNQVTSYEPTGTPSNQASAKWS